MSQDLAPAPLAWQPAALGDAPAVLDLMRAFYAEEGLAFDGRAQGRALDMLLAEPELGRVFLLRGPAPRDPPQGHLVLTRGHSLEFGGGFWLLDELYLAPALRGRGEGRRALALAEKEARARGMHALRLEVARKNFRALQAYLRYGYVAEDRDLMTLRLT